MSSKPSTNDRMEKAREIAANPVAYKVCEGCDSIVAAHVVICPSCHSYRYDQRPERVIDQALELGSREQRSVSAQDLD